MTDREKSYVTELEYLLRYLCRCNATIGEPLHSFSELGVTIQGIVRQIQTGN